MNNNDLLLNVFDKIKHYLNSQNNNNQPVINYKTPTELKDIIDFSVSPQAVSKAQFVKLIDQYLEYSVKTGNKQFLNQLYSGFNLPAFVGEICSALSNTSMYTYEVAPVATLIEIEMINLMNRYTGYDQGDGIFVSGGSNANMLAMFSARNQYQPEIRKNGYDRNLKLVAFVSEHAHYSFDTAANLLGLGATNVIKVKTDGNGSMLMEALEDKINQSLARGEKPFFVAATCATTVYGAYDPLDKMADICKKYNIWLHADGSFGGSILLSKQHKKLMKGIECTDSCSWNPHKLMNIPLICSALLVRKKGVLTNNITDLDSDYLYHDIDEIEDLGKKSIQCGRNVDAVKLWFAWQYFGLDGYEKRIDNLIQVAQYAENKVTTNPNLELMAPRQSFALCFRYRPVVDIELNRFNLELRESLKKNGKSMVNFAYIEGALTIRLVTTNGEMRKSDIDQFFEDLCQQAKMLETTVNLFNCNN